TSFLHPPRSQVRFQPRRAFPAHEDRPLVSDAAQRNRRFRGRIGERRQSSLVGCFRNGFRTLAVPVRPVRTSPSPHPMGYVFSVAQVSNLLYRRASSLPEFGRGWAYEISLAPPIGNRRYSRLETCATQLWASAKHIPPRCGALLEKRIQS